MDSDVAKYSEARYTEIKDEMKHMLTKVGWKKDFVDNNVPFLPISGWMGDNLIKKSENMKWWTGSEIKSLSGKAQPVVCLLDYLNTVVELPERDTAKPLRVPISGIYKIKGVGDVLAGRVEQGTVKPNDEVRFMPTHTAANKCEGKVCCCLFNPNPPTYDLACSPPRCVCSALAFAADPKNTRLVRHFATGLSCILRIQVFSVEMHHKRVDAAGPGDNVGMNIKGLDKGNMPRAGDVMIMKSDPSLKHVEDFSAQIQTLDIPGELKMGYSPIGFVRCGRSACRMTKIDWKVCSGAASPRGAVVLEVR
jgi:elongation factor 1-alpha